MSNVASLKRLIKAMSREPNGVTRTDMLAGINAMLDDLMSEEPMITAMAPPMIDFFEGKVADYSDTEVISEEVESGLTILLKARKAQARDGLNDLRIEIDPVTGEKRVLDMAKKGYAEANGLDVDRNGNFVKKDRKSRVKVKPKPASIDNPNWGTFA